MQTSRYDAAAEWYAQYTRDWDLPVDAFLPADLSGQRVLDLASGWGQLSRRLAPRGAEVTAVEIAAPFVALARSIEVETPQGIHYVQGDASGLDWWDGTPYDGVVCNMALMDTDDLDGALRGVSAVLLPGGWFCASLLHPCFPGSTGGQGNTLPSWPPSEGYAREGWWTTHSTGVCGHVGAHHRMLSTYLNAVLTAGLAFEELIEPPAPVPRTLVMRCRKP